VKRDKWPLPEAVLDDPTEAHAKALLMRWVMPKVIAGIPMWEGLILIADRVAQEKRNESQRAAQVEKAARRGRP
jgi:hypothetical protein